MAKPQCELCQQEVDGNFPCGHGSYLCRPCAKREPTNAEKLTALRIFLRGEPKHPSYIIEKAEEVIGTQSLDFLLGSMDNHNQQRFLEGVS